MIEYDAGMNEITVRLTGDELTINGRAWDRAPSIDEFCCALQAADPIDGNPIIIRGKPEAKFRYFDDLGIAIVETIPAKSVRGATIFMEAPPLKIKRRSPYKNYGNTGKRTTKGTFSGTLFLNGRSLRSPVPFTAFPLEGDLNFIHRIAIGRRISASVFPQLRYVLNVSFDFGHEYCA